MDKLAADTSLEDSFAWLEHLNPVTDRFAARVRKLDLRGRRLSCWQHLLPDTILQLLPFAEAGARVRVGACNPDSTDPRVVRYLERHDIEVFDTGRKSEAERQAALAAFAADADVICDMGGELIEAATRGGSKVRGALEATMTGVHRIRELNLPFPVFNWNNIRIKDSLHNRYHVGESIWPAFGAIAGLSLFGRTVLVVGFGPVGHGIAERARAMGAVVLVAELDPVRQLEAQHAGCRVVPLTQGVAEADITVTATGRDGVLGEAALRAVRNEAIVFNAGHSNREIDVDWLDAQPKRRMKDHIERYEIGDRSMFLLNRGSMVNLASGAFTVSDSFDPFLAIMLRGLEWLMQDDLSAYAPGIHDYPPNLEREVAAVTVTRGQGG
jgi:adenosylhomocysteinase